MKVNRLVIETESELRNLLDQMFMRSKQDEPFYGLLELMKNEQVILTAVHKIKSNKGSKTVGVDRRTTNDYLKMEKAEFLEVVRKSIDNYKPSPVRRHLIPKSGFQGYILKANKEILLKEKKIRPLGIPTIIDRIIQEIARTVLDPIFEAKFFNHSYGFRPYRSCEYAIGQITRTINFSKLYVAVEGDIESFFDNVNHNKLIELMWKMGIKDKRVLAIIKKMLKAGIMDECKYMKSEVGTPQGGIISPLLANIYLNNFDWMIGKEYEFHPCIEGYREKKNALASLRNKGHHPVFLVRYADDWVILTDTLEHAEKIKAKCEKYLKHKLGLNLSPKKTLITDMREKPIKFLGFKIKVGKQRFGEKLVSRAIPDRDRVVPKVREIAREIRYIRTRKTEAEKAIDIEKINAKIIGLSNYYKAGIASHLLSWIDYVLEVVMYKTWLRMYGLKIKNYKGPINTLTNRKDRHDKYTYKSFFVIVDGVRVGFTKAKITSINYAEVYKQEMTPYTLKGREIYWKKTEKRRRYSRPMLSNPEDIWLYSQHKRTSGGAKYNLEYFLNREYTYNRDKGECRICKEYLTPYNLHCHHVDNKLPMEKINKVNNLISVCKPCHEIIHNETMTINDEKMMSKVENYRKKLNGRSA